MKDFQVGWHTSLPRGNLRGSYTKSSNFYEKILMEEFHISAEEYVNMICHMFLWVI